MRPRPSRRYPTLVAVISIVLLAAACSSSGSTDVPETLGTPQPVVTAGPSGPDPEDFETYENRAVGLAIAYPKPWTVQERVGSTLVGFIASSGPDAQGGFVDNANISLEEVGETTLDEYNATARSQIITVFPGAVIEDESRATLGGQPAFAYQYLATQGGETVRIRQVFTLHDQGLTALSFAAAVGRWEALQPQFATMESSFRFLG